MSSPKLVILRATAYHEAGHAMASWNLKKSVGRGKHVLSIVSTGTTQGYFRSENMLEGFRPDIDITDAGRLKMEREVVVLLAGMVAQRRYRPSSVRSWHGSSDFHAAVDLVSYLATSNKEIEAYLKLLRVRAELTLERPGSWECVEALAASLLDRKTLSASEAVEIIHAAQARMIASRQKQA